MFASVAAPSIVIVPHLTATVQQEHFALETELMEVLNTLLCAEIEADSDQVEEEEDACKTTILKTFMALTECQKSPSLVFDRLMSAVHAESLTRHLRMPAPPVPLDTIKDEIEHAEAVHAQMKLEQRPLSDMQVGCLVLVQIMCDYNPDFPNEVNLAETVREKIGREVVSIEIVWGNELQRRFFHVPQMCKKLAGATRDNFVQAVNRENRDLKLQDFARRYGLVVVALGGAGETDLAPCAVLCRCKSVMCELEHQEMIREMGFAKLINADNLNTMTWISFAINVCINMLSLQYLGMPDDDRGEYGNQSYAMEPPVLSNKKAEVAQEILNYMQITCASLTLILYLIVRSPVVHRVHGAKQVMHPINGLTPYYVLYIVFAVLGVEQPFFNSLLLFDILVKNSTSRDVLLAVTKPARQIAATAVLLLIVIYVR